MKREPGSAYADFSKATEIDPKGGFDGYRIPGDTAATFLVLESCQCRLTIFGVAVLAKRLWWSFVRRLCSWRYWLGFDCLSNVRNFELVCLGQSCAKSEPTVVWSGDVPTFEGRDAAVPAIVTTIAPRPTKQTPLPTIPITANPSNRACWFVVSSGWIQAVKGQARKSGGIAEVVCRTVNAAH
jgi:hypothetical protein